MTWSRTAIYVAFAATVGGLYSLRPHAEPGVISTVACYMALANDITPLLMPGEPDVAASSPECTAQTTLDEGRHRDGVGAAGVRTRVRMPNGG